MRLQKKSYVCSKCGYSEQSSVKIVEAAEGTTSEAMKTIDTADMAGVSTVDEQCPKCGYGKATWFMQQTRGGDEPTTRFYRCVRCRHTWREYA